MDLIAIQNEIPYLLTVHISDKAWMATLLTDLEASRMACVQLKTFN